MIRPCHSIDTLEDPRVSVYRNLRDRDLAGEGERARFIAEGEQVVRRLLESDFPVESVLLAQRRADEIAPLVPEPIPVYVTPDPLIHQIMGYKFHSGVIACGRRKARPTLEMLMSHTATRPLATLVICPEVANTENLGALMRIAAGFGADGMILGQHCCDPFYRQAIRVSMGAVFRLNLMQTPDLVRDLRRLKSEWQVELAATVLDPAAEPLASAQRRGRHLGLLFGNEAQGLPAHLIEECDRKITIPMSFGTDSLNVSIAAAVVLYHFTML